MYKIIEIYVTCLFIGLLTLMALLFAVGSGYAVFHPDKMRGPCHCSQNKGEIK